MEFANRLSMLQPQPSPANSGASVFLNPMNFTENQQGNAVLEKLRQQRETGRFCDVVLVVKDRQFPAHRNILAACSPYFDSILKMHKVVKEQVTVNCQNADVFDLMLSYMYSGSVVIDKSNVAELLKLAHNFLVSKLKNYCAEYLDRYMDTTNCLSVKDLADKYNMPGVAKNAISFISSNFERVSLENDEYLELELVGFRSFCDNYSLPTGTIFRNQQMLLSLPKARLICAVRWCLRDFDGREMHFKFLLQNGCLDLKRFDRQMFGYFLDNDLLNLVLATNGSGGANPVVYLLNSSGDQQQTAGTVLAVSRHEQLLFTILETSRQVDNNFLSHKHDALYHSLAVKRTGDVSVFFNTPSAPSSQQLASSNDGSLENHCSNGHESFDVKDSAPPSGIMTNGVVEAEQPVTVAANTAIIIVDPVGLLSGGGGSDSVDPSAQSAALIAPKISPNDAGSLLTKIKIQKSPEKVYQNETMSSANSTANGAASNALSSLRPLAPKLTVLTASASGTSAQAALKTSNDSSTPISVSYRNNFDDSFGSAQSAPCGTSTHSQLPPLKIKLNKSLLALASGDKHGASSTSTLVGRSLSHSEATLTSPPPAVRFSPENTPTILCVEAVPSPSIDDHEGAGATIATSSRRRRRQKRVASATAVDSTKDAVSTGDQDDAASTSSTLFSNDDAGVDSFHASTSLTFMDRAEVVFQCPHCVYKSRCQSRIQAHIGRAHRKNVVFTCTVCNFQCKWNRQYYMHMKEHFQGPPFSCDRCEYTADRIHMLLTHRMKHTDEKPYKCRECDYRCRTKTNLVAHMRSHTGEKPFTCGECGRGFAIKSTLDQHLATHSEKRPYTCDHCPFSTKYQSHLISHRRIHTGDVFYCQFSDCNYSSPKKSQLAAHMRTHMAVRDFACSKCSRSFVEKSHLIRHERIHLDEKPFKCSICPYASSRRDKLKEHVFKHHGHPDVDSRTAQLMKTERLRFSSKNNSSSSKTSRTVNSMSKGTAAASGFKNIRSISSTSGFVSSTASTPTTQPQQQQPPNAMNFLNSVSVDSLDLSSQGVQQRSSNCTISDGQILMNSLEEGGSGSSPLNSNFLSSVHDLVRHPEHRNKDVLLSSRVDSPHSSSNSLLSDPLPNASSPLFSDLSLLPHRPSSVPPLGALQQQQLGFWSTSAGQQIDFSNFMF